VDVSFLKIKKNEGPIVKYLLPMEVLAGLHVSYNY